MSDGGSAETFAKHRMPPLLQCNAGTASPSVREEFCTSSFRMPRTVSGIGHTLTSR